MEVRAELLLPSATILVKSSTRDCTPINKRTSRGGVGLCYLKGVRGGTHCALGPITGGSFSEGQGKTSHTPTGALHFAKNTCCPWL